MAGTVEYILSIADRASGPLVKVAGASQATLSKFAQLTAGSKAFQSTSIELGGSLSTLRQRLDLLKSKKEILDPRNLSQIKRYNREIDGLTGRIERLDNAGRGGKLKGYLSQLGGALGGALTGPVALGGGLTNPIALGGAAVGFAAKRAMALDEGMAKVNITAQLDKASLAKATEQVKAIAGRHKTDVVQAPIALEQIISQTGDLDLSMSILDATLKGAKSQFTSTDVVAGALARTLSVVGKENTNAQEVLDTFVAAKRVGAGEFGDFAAYMPGLIAGADALGIKYKEVAGTFAYMTGMGQRPDQANVLMDNLFSVLGRGEVRDKLSRSGVDVYDDAGDIRALPDIFGDMQKVTGGMNDEQKSGFIEKLGIVDKDAKSAFMVMAADTGKLADSLTEVANSAGATDRALELSKNSVQSAQELWNVFNNNLTNLGVAILPAVNAGIAVAGPLLDGVATVVTAAFEACSWWFDALRDGNPLIWGLTAAGAAASVMLTVHKFKLIEAATWTKGLTAVTGFLTKAMGFLKMAFLTTPWGWVALGVGALAGLLAGLAGKTDKATKSFAAFNSELHRTQDETRGSFDAAMKAKEGSEQRAASIKKINEQYGPYLSAMLTEKTTNNELAVALQVVNDKLEDKLRVKFRNMRIEAIENTKDEARKKLFDWVAERVAPEHLEEAVGDLSRGLVDMQDNKAEWWQVQDLLSRKYGVGGYEFTEAFKNVKGGGWNPFVTGGNGGRATDGNVYNSFGKRLLWMTQTNWQAEQDRKVVDAQYSDAGQKEQSTPAVNLFVNGVYQPVGFGTNARDAMFAKPGQTAPAVVGAVAPLAAAGDNEASGIPGMTNAQYRALLASLGGGNGNTRSGGNGGNAFDLDSVAVNEKGSGAYNAIVSKLGRVRLAGLTAAASLGVGMASPALAQAAALPANTATELPAMPGADNTDYGDPNRQKMLNLDKFCDQIVINIANTDQKGEDEIRERVMKVLMEVADGQS